MRAAVMLVGILASGCYAELTAGYYKASGGVDDDAYQIGIAFGTYLEYSKFVRVGVGGEGALVAGAANEDGELRPRTVGTTIRGDLSLVGDALNRLRATGGVNLAGAGDARLKVSDDMKTYGDATSKGWFAGLSFEQTDVTKVSRQWTIAMHQIDLSSDLFDDADLTGVQARMTFTFWPVFRRVSPGFFAAIMNGLANNSVAGEGDIEQPEYWDTRAPRSRLRSCSIALNGESCTYLE